jgi:hypothetical protein
MEMHYGLSCLQYFYFKGLSRIKHIVLELGNGWIQMILIWYVCQTHITLGLADCQAQVPGVLNVFQTHATLGFVDRQAQVL